MENVQIQQLMNTAFKRKESYTSLSLLKQCPYRYYLHYIQKQHADTKSIALEIGNLCHKIMENKYLGLNIDLQKELYSGHPDNEEIKGIDEIRKNYDLSILMTTHHLSLLPRYADQVVLIDGGIRAKGTAQEVLSSDAFQAIFHMKGGSL